MVRRSKPERNLRIAMLLLAFLFGTAIFAPLIASDLPVTMVAVDERAFVRALRSLPLVVTEFVEVRADESSDDVRVKAATEAVVLRIDVLERGLEDPDRKSLARFETAFERASRETSELAELPLHANRLKDELKLEAADAGGVRLQPTRSFPIFAALSPLNSFLMGGFVITLLAPLWWIRRRTLGLCLGVLICCLLSAASWQWGNANDLSGLKASMAQGDVRVESALFAPVAFGFAETHLSEGFLAPTWLRETSPSNRLIEVDVRPGEPSQDSLQRHWLGTDALGRDVLARLLHGGRLSLSVAMMAALLVTSLGVVFGTLAGMFGGWVDLAFLRVVEIVQSFPSFLLILAGVAFVPESQVHPSITIALVIGIVGWTEIGRLVRAEFLALRELDLATAAYALGIGPLRVAFHHLLPLALPSVFVAAAFATSGAVLTESAISFLGFGIGPPAPSWGGLIAVERDASVWWLQLFPGLFVFLTVVGFNLLGEAMRQRLNPETEPKRTNGVKA